jgi:hypothetical protein
VIEDLRAHGLSLPAIAEKLTAAGYVTRTGKPWNAMQVSRVLQRSGADRRGRGRESETSLDRLV